MQRKTFTEFIDSLNKTNDSMENFIEQAIEYYHLQSYIRINELENKKVLHLSSIAEENTLNKIIQIAMSDEEITVESVFEGYVIRRH